MRETFGDARTAVLVAPANVTCGSMCCEVSASEWSS